MTVDIDSVRILTDSIKAATERKPDGSTVSATVTETGSNVAWVRIDGSSGDTPVTQSTVSVSVGDRVSVRIENGSATITGNLSNVSTGAAETRAAVEPVKAVAESAEQAAERATDYASTAKNAAQSAVQSAADAGRAAAVAQAAMGSTTVDWHDYTVSIGTDGQWHAFDKDGVEVPFSEISMVYQDSTGVNVIGEHTRLNVGSSAVDIFDTESTGESVARFGKGLARIGSATGSNVSMSDSSISVVGKSGKEVFHADEDATVVGSVRASHFEATSSGVSVVEASGYQVFRNQIGLSAEYGPIPIRVLRASETAQRVYNSCSYIRYEIKIENVPFSETRQEEPSVIWAEPLSISSGGTELQIYPDVFKSVEGGSSFTVIRWEYRNPENKSATIYLSADEGLAAVTFFDFGAVEAAVIDVEYEQGNRRVVFGVDYDGNVTADGTVSNGNVLDMADSWFFFGYITSSSKGVRACFPLPGFGWKSASVSGTLSYSIRGGSGATLTGSVSSFSTVEVRNGGSVLYLDWTLGSAFAGGNNVAISGYASGLTITLE